jgi:hypothetical protein
MTRIVHLLFQIGLLAMIFPVSSDTWNRSWLLFGASLGQIALLVAEGVLDESEGRNTALLRMCCRAFVVYFAVLIGTLPATFFFRIPLFYLTSWFYGAYGLIVFAAFVSLILFVRGLRTKSKPAKTSVL